MPLASSQVRASPSTYMLLPIIAGYMHRELLRVSHEAVQAAHHSHSASTHQFLLYFLISFIVLVIAAYFYLRSPVNAAFFISITPTESERIAIFVMVIVGMGVLGLFAAVDSLWSSHTWLLYALFNLLLAAYIFAYQTTKGYSLLLSCIIMTFMLVVSHWFFSRVAYDGKDIVMLLVAGAIEAWALLWFLYVLGQTIVYDCGMDRKAQSMCFFITAVILLTIVTFWHIRDHGSWSGFIGFVGTGVILLLFVFFRHYNSSPL